MKARRASGLVAMLVLTACGVVPGQGSSTSLPSPPTAALAKWTEFPANANPRPIVWLSNPGPSGGGFVDGDSKIAALCNKYALANGLHLSAVAPNTVTASWPSGIRASYGGISEAEAFVGISRLPGDAKNPDCARVPPLLITSVRAGRVGIGTDRGTAQVSAWLFIAKGANGDLAYPAIDPSAYWHGGMTNNQGNGGVQGAVVSADDLSVTVGFIGAESSGACGANYIASSAESDHAVAVAIKEVPLNGDHAVACDAVGHSRTVSVTLMQPLLGRVLLDAYQNVVPVCPSRQAASRPRPASNLLGGARARR